MPARQWTKGDVFDYFGVKDSPEYTNGGQIWSGAILICKCRESVAFINEWYYVMHNHHYLATDAPSKVPNAKDFIENRHDQSILDVLSRKYTAIRLPFSETYRMDEDWSLMTQYPIWCTRKRNRHQSFIMKVKKKIKSFLSILYSQCNRITAKWGA